MAEKRMHPSKFFFCLIVVSMFLLMISSLFLLQSGGNLLAPMSVFKLVNNHSSYFKPNSASERVEVPLLSTVDCQTVALSRTTGAAGKAKNKGCDPDLALLRVFMYDLPPEFHFGLLGWKGKVNQTWPNVSNSKKIPPYPGGLNLQHSVEYWLTLDLLSSEIPSVVRPCTAIRVKKASEADIIFVPFFSSLSYNRHSKIRGKDRGSVNRILQDKLVNFLENQKEWKQSGGKNHLIIAHHPNSMLAARRKLGSAKFVLADFGRYPVDIANIQKDVIAPYRHLVKTTPRYESHQFEERPILVYFQGAIYRKDGGFIRQELYYLLKDEADVHFTFGTVGSNGIRKAGEGMASSKFCLNIAGDTPSSNRLFDAIASHCVPVIISDEIELPFEDTLDYSDFCIFVRASDAIKKGYLLNLLRGINKEKWSRMWVKLKEVENHFEYQYPSRPGDAVDMIWKEVSRKMSAMRFQIHRKNRYQKSSLLSRRI